MKQTTILASAMAALLLSSTLANASELPQCSNPLVTQTVTELAKAAAVKVVMEDPRNIYPDGIGVEGAPPPATVSPWAAAFIKAFNEATYTYSAERVDSETPATKFCAATVHMDGWNVATQKQNSGEFAIHYSVQLTEDGKFFLCPIVA